MDIYLIRWIDAHVPEIGWHDVEQLRDEFEAEFEISSVGFLFGENKDYISLVQNAEVGGDKMSSMICIPVACIREKTKLS